MQPPPKLWRCLTREWVPLPDQLALAWWFALDKARWSLACEWREAFLAFHRQGGWVSGEMVEAFFAQVATPPVLFGLMQALRQEGVLLARDCRRLEAALLQQMTREGEWTHPRKEGTYAR